MSEFVPSRLDRDAVFYVAGHRGLVGSAIWRKLESEGFANLVGRTHRELDLTDRDAVFEFMKQTQPRYMVIAAAKVGGILANDTYPVDFLSENLQIQTNLLDSAVQTGVERVLFLGSSCIYPAHAPQPIKEEYLMTGPLEPTNFGYAIAKISGIKQVQAVRKQYGYPWISAMPTNLYGPNDNFDPSSSHVLPALIRRYENATRSGATSIVNWGTGTPRREFLYVDDLADACLFLLEKYDGESHVNVGTGHDLTIAELADLVGKATGFRGMVSWDISKPDGMSQKVLDVNIIESLGWRASIELEDGIRQTVNWYRKAILDAQQSSDATPRA